MGGDQDEYDTLADEIDALWERQDSAEFVAALRRLEGFAQSGDPDAAEWLGEIRALHGPQRDPEGAYRWYFIALSQRGFLTEFDDRNQSPPNYCGPVGDFRNESMVSELVAELGFDRARALDAEARDWLRARGIDP